MWALQNAMLRLLLVVSCWLLVGGDTRGQKGTLLRSSGQKYALFVNRAYLAYHI